MRRATERDKYFAHLITASCLDKRNFQLLLLEDRYIGCATHPGRFQSLPSAYSKPNHFSLTRTVVVFLKLERKLCKINFLG